MRLNLYQVGNAWSWVLQGDEVKSGLADSVRKAMRQARIYNAGLPFEEIYLDRHKAHRV